MIGDRSKNLPSDGAPENLRGCTEVDGTVGGLRVHALAEEAVVLHFLTDKAAGEADFLAADHHHALSIEKLLRQDGCQTSQHVVPRVHHHSPSADSRSRHHFAMPFSPLTSPELSCCLVELNCCVISKKQRGNASPTHLIAKQKLKDFDGEGKINLAADDKPAVLVVVVLGDLGQSKDLFGTHLDSPREAKNGVC
nr:hypothetical protein CKAN_00693800 [Ipomoea batatas]